MSPNWKSIATPYSFLNRRRIIRSLRRRFDRRTLRLLVSNVLSRGKEMKSRFLFTLVALVCVFSVGAVFAQVNDATRQLSHDILSNWGKSIRTDWVGGTPVAAT